MRGPATYVTVDAGYHRSALCFFLLESHLRAGAGTHIHSWLMLGLLLGVFSFWFYRLASGSLVLKMLFRRNFPEIHQTHHKVSWEST
jgi:hypothetical protein